MNEYKWIKQHGVIEEDEIINQMMKYEGKENSFLAYSTDSFYAGKVEKEQLEQLMKYEFSLKQKKLVFNVVLSARCFSGELLLRMG